MIRQQQPALVCVVDSHPSDYGALLDEVANSTTRIEFLSSGREALRTNPEDPPSLWIVNLQLPDMSGADLQTMLRARGCQSPIALVGDQYCAEDEINARCSGASMYFAKPLATDMLLAGCS